MLDSIGCLDEINSADNLCLPFHLKTKWLEAADISFKGQGLLFISIGILAMLLKHLY